MNTRLLGLSALFAALPVLAGTPAADLIIHGGEIITINELQPRAEAVAVANGRIAAVGYLDEIMPLKGEHTEMLDLQGQTLVPGFIDAHGHVFNVGIQALAANLLAAPDGSVQDIPALQDTLRTWGSGNTAASLGWIIGMGYDDAQLKEQRHPTRDDLDQVSRDRPVLAIHQSGHLAAVNSKALELAGLDADTPNPPGGVIRRRAGSNEPDGVLEENAFWRILSALPQLTDEDMDTIALAGQALYLRYGFTTAQEGRATRGANNTWARLAERQALKLDVASYPDMLLAAEQMQSPYAGRDYRNGFRIAGVKLNLDGSPQGKTAWLTRPYFKVPAGQPDDYAGYPALDEAQVLEQVSQAFANGWQVLAHVNGDAAIDQFIRAVQAAEAQHGRADRRPVAIHAQVAREDQVEAFRTLGIFPSFFPMHTFYWGDWHRQSVLGPQRGANISPTGWAMQRSMIFSTHHDAPIAFPDSMRVLSATVTRVARGSGDVVGPEHRVPPLTALKAMTLWSAWQHFEESHKGSIEAGKLADFVVLSDNPLSIAPEQIAQIKVLQTIKKGQAVHRLAAPNSAEARELQRSCAADSRCFRTMAHVGGHILGMPLHPH